MKKNINKILTATFLFLTPLIVKAVELPNPLQANSVPDLARNVIQGLLGVSGAIALFYLVWGGITWMTSQGNSERIKKGKDTIVWAIFGLAAIFFSYVILDFLFCSLVSGASCS
jgi:hypothetical protein